MTLSRQYMPLRRSLCHFSAQTRRAPCNFQNTFRRYSAEKRSSEPKSFVVWRPYLRLAIGVPFIGALIYSMMTGEVTELDSPSIVELDEALKKQATISENSPMRLRMEKLIKEHQKKIVDELSRIDGTHFKTDTWARPNGGGGISCVLQDGNVFEKAGVNVSVVYGELPRAAIEKMRADHKSFAWCDKYFYLPHRRESRGVGGIFFDDLDASFLESSATSSQNPQETLFSFVSDSLASFLPSYVPIIERRKDTPFTPAQKEWQQLRRGRYVEFNLVYDRGTSFGLRTPNARIESILMSLPRTASWAYMDPVSGTRTEASAEEKNPGEDKEREKELMDVLRHPRQWV
ncbi:hypothetical protein AFLA_002723 [Aspergillus flavus NRRL3357]|nr:hypothetical protein AFLA_002723 [Aspergillus flavus NRRL3357]